MILMPTFPPIEEFRAMADERAILPTVCAIECHLCKHSVDFKSREEAQRFLQSSHWRALTERVICPVCSDNLSKPSEKTWRAPIRRAA